MIKIEIELLPLSADVNESGQMTRRNFVGKLVMPHLGMEVAYTVDMAEKENGRVVATVSVSGFLPTFDKELSAEYTDEYPDWGFSIESLLLRALGTVAAHWIAVRAARKAKAQEAAAAEKEKNPSLN